jgi:hypothetical protein
LPASSEAGHRGPRQQATPAPSIADSGLVVTSPIVEGGLAGVN